MKSFEEEIEEVKNAKDQLLEFLGGSAKLRDIQILRHTQTILNQSKAKKFYTFASCPNGGFEIYFEGEKLTFYNIPNAETADRLCAYFESGFHQGVCYAGKKMIEFL